MPRIRAVTPNGVRTVSAPLSFRMENARKKAVRKIPGSPYSERSIYNPRNGGGRVYQYSTEANSSFPL